MWNLVLWFMQAATVMVISLAKGIGKFKWKDFVCIMILFLISSISFTKENSCEDFVAVVMVEVLYNENWIKIVLKFLDPGDRLSVKVGDNIPEDVQLVEGNPLKLCETIS